MIGLSSFWVLAGAQPETGNTARNWEHSPEHPSAFSVYDFCICRGIGHRNIPGAVALSHALLRQDRALLHNVPLPPRVVPCLPFLLIHRGILPTLAMSKLPAKTASSKLLTLRRKAHVLLAAVGVKLLLDGLNCSLQGISACETELGDRQPRSWNCDWPRLPNLDASQLLVDFLEVAE